MDLPGDRVDLWLVSLPADYEAPAAIERWLSADERRRADGLMRPTSRQYRRVAYGARRAVLSFYAPRDRAAWRFVTDEHGRPQILHEPDNPTLYVSLSHTDGLVAVAVARTAELGVDVERIDRRYRVIDIADRCFAPEETAMLRASPAAEMPALFVTLWTLKESYLKARGVGIWGGVPLDACRFEIADDGDVHFCPARDIEHRPGEWRFFAVKPTAGHRATVAVRISPAGAPRLAAFALTASLDRFRPIAIGQRGHLLNDSEDLLNDS